MIFVIIIIKNAENSKEVGNQVLVRQSLLLVAVFSLFICILVVVAASTNEMYADHR